MGLDLEDLEKRIERKISDLENEKNRLRDDLKVVRQASEIASDFEHDGGSPGWQPEHSQHGE